METKEALVVVVTGAAGGLGSEVVRRFARDGSRVVALDLRQEAVERLARGTAGEVLALAADLTDRSRLDRAVAQALAAHGRIDVLVNAAGGTQAMLGMGPNKSLLDHTDEEWRRVLAVNLDGTFNVLRAVAPVMVRQGGGSIVLVASGTGIRPGPNMSSYAAAKAGTIGLMKAAARELGPHGVRVNAVNPGLITHEQLDLGGASVDGYLGETMLGRLSSPAEFAEGVLFVSRATALSGQTVNVDSRVLW